jgi:hypothetical protein
MYEVLTSPITLLCLGVVFLLISLLFFYFKRSLSLLERAQMEQARVLQSFITNMEMTRLRQYQPPEQHTPSYNDDHVGGQSDIVHTESNEQLIDVSDDDSDDSGDSGDDSDDDSDSDNDEETVNNENVSAVSINGLSILEIDELENSDDEIKVIQLQENNLEEISVELLKVVELPPMVEQKYNTNIDINDSISDSSVDSDTDSDDENVSETNDILQNEPITSIHKIPSVQELMTNNEVKEDIVSTDLKTLTLQKLRQIAVEKELIQTGSKPNKKELIKLIEDSTQ